jgi:hypothetical protein
MIPRLQRGTVEFARLSRLYACRSGVHPALAPYPTLDALLTALLGRGQAEPETRRRLLCAVLVEHRAAPGPLGAAIVLHAFRGMLVGLSKSLVGVDDPDEADAIVAAGLIEALGHVRADRDPRGIGLRIRQKTRRAVFAALRRDAPDREDLDGGDADFSAATACADDPASPGADPGAGSEELSEDERTDEDSREDACDDGLDGEWLEEPMRDPLALERASRERGPDDTADFESTVPLEDRMLFYRPSVEAIPEETVLQAHAVRGGLRRLACMLFEHADRDEQRRMYRRLVARAEELAAAREGV